MRQFLIFSFILSYMLDHALVFLKFLQQFLIFSFCSYMLDHVVVFVKFINCPWTFVVDNLTRKVVHRDNPTRKVAASIPERLSNRVNSVHNTVYAENALTYKWNVVCLGESQEGLSSANHSKTGEQSVFSKIHTILVFGTPQRTLWHRNFDSQTKYAAVTEVTDTQNDYSNPFEQCMRAEG